MTVPRVLYCVPPNFRAINKAFNVRGKPILFAYGDAIYNPNRIEIPPQLIEHEKVHLARQAGDPAVWWLSYIGDPQFRLAEELPAHVAECQHILFWRPNGAERDREIARIAERLASPLYGNLIDKASAQRLILHGKEGVAG